MPEKVNLKAYFERIGFAGSIAPTAATLELLHALHPAAIPFENLAPLAGQGVPLDQPSLERKLLAEKRGGYCFEHNFLFMRVLRELDYGVKPLLARVLWNHPEGADAPPTHMLLLVDVNGQNYLADVGFGGLTLTTPLRLRAEAEQATPHETFRLVGGDPDWTLEVRLGEEWRKVYVFSTSEASEEALSAINERIATDPASPFTHELRVALSPSGRRLKLHNTQLSVQPLEGAAEKTTLASLAQLRETLSTVFGLALPEAPALDTRLLALLPEPEPEPDEV